MFYVDFGIRGILYIFLCKDLIVIMILHLVILILNFCTPEQNTPVGEMGLVSIVFIISLNTMSLFFSSLMYRLL